MDGVNFCWKKKMKGMHLLIEKVKWSHSISPDQRGYQTLGWQVFYC